MADGSVPNACDTPVEMKQGLPEVHDDAIAEIVAPRENDPIQGFLDAGISLRRLLWHGIVNLDWLAKQSDKKLRISYRNNAGELVAEKVTRLGLLRRAEELGWSPWPSEPGQEEHAQIAFLQAVPFEDRGGVFWWTTEWDEASSAPLCFPEKKLRFLAERAQRQHKAHMREIARQNAARARDARRQSRERLKSLEDEAVQTLVTRAANRGRRLAASTARRAWRKSCRKIEERMKEQLAMAAKEHQL